MATPEKLYNASYTSGGLLQREITALLPLILNNEISDGFRQEKRENQLLQINSEEARRRIVDQVRKRVRHVNTDVWVVYESATEVEQSLLLYYVCLKTYRLLREFHFDILVARWRSLQRTLDAYDLKQKLDELATIYPEVDAWTELTKRKIVQVSRLMMVQAGFIAGTQIQKPAIANALYEQFVRWGDSWMLEASLLNESERNTIINESI
ncbi:BrxA family protein [Spirosoma pulveris]